MIFTYSKRERIFREAKGLINIKWKNIYNYI